MLNRELAPRLLRSFLSAILLYACFATPTFAGLVAGFYVSDTDGNLRLVDAIGGQTDSAGRDH